MESKKLFFGILILTFLLIETAIGESHGSLEKKNDNDSEHIEKKTEALSVNLTSISNIAKETDNPVIVASSPNSNVTESANSALDKKARKALRKKQRRTHHKRKQHQKRARKTKRRNENKENSNHELATASVIGNGGNSELTSDHKQGSPDRRGRSHHHKKASKRNRRQQRRLQRGKKSRARAQKKHAKKLAETEGQTQATSHATP